jgi:RNase H-like domain found in reverse transcriptase
LEIITKESLFLKPEKCQFTQWTMEFLGYVIDQGTIWVDPSKSHGLKNWSREHRNVREVWRTLGVLGYQRRFIPRFMDIVRPLTNLLKKGVKFIWTPECKSAVDQLIESVITDPVLQQPDHTKPYTLEVDASQYTSGAILYQPDDQSQLQPVGYYSKTFNQAERNYNIHDRELLVMMKGLEY